MSNLSEERIADLRQVAQSMGPGSLAFQTIHALLNQIESLQAVVKRLPHDAEGVPCLPGDERWAWTHRGTDKVLLRGYAFWESGGESGKHIGFGIRAHSVATNTGFSTEAAAKDANDGPLA